MANDKIKHCDSCNSAIYKHSRVKVTVNGRIYCSECKVPKKEAVIFEGFLRGIFCSECDKIVLEDQRKNPDINGRVFCSDEHHDEFYKKVSTCNCCGIEI